MAIVLNGSANTITGLAKGGLPHSALAAGAVVQAVSFSYTSLDDITSKTWTDTSLTKAITTTIADSSILAIVSMSWAFNRSSASGGFGLRLVRDSTTIYQGEDDGTNGPEGFYIGPFNGNAVWRSFWNPTYLDVIGSHSNTTYTYKVQAAVTDESSSDRIRINKASSAKSTITLMEVVA
jgi:hypothetical protein